MKLPYRNEPCPVRVEAMTLLCNAAGDVILRPNDGAATSVYKNIDDMTPEQWTESVLNVLVPQCVTAMIREVSLRIAAEKGSAVTAAAASGSRLFVELATVGALVSRTLHSFGVNIACLGAVLRCARIVAATYPPSPTDDDVAQQQPSSSSVASAAAQLVSDAVSFEIACRSVKHVVRAEAVEASSSSSDVSQHPFAPPSASPVFVSQVQRVMALAANGDATFWSELNDVAVQRFGDPGATWSAWWCRGQEGAADGPSAPPAVSFSIAVVKVLTWSLTPKQGLVFDQQNGKFHTTHCNAVVLGAALIGPPLVSRLVAAGSSEQAALTATREWDAAAGVRPTWLVPPVQLLPPSVAAEAVATGGKEAAQAKPTSTIHARQGWRPLDRGGKLFEVTPDLFQVVSLQRAAYLAVVLRWTTHQETHLQVITGATLQTLRCESSGLASLVEHLAPEEEETTSIDLGETYTEIPLTTSWDADDDDHALGGTTGGEALLLTGMVADLADGCGQHAAPNPPAAESGDAGSVAADTSSARLGDTRLLPNWRDTHRRLLQHQLKAVRTRQAMISMGLQEALKTRLANRSNVTLGLPTFTAIYPVLLWFLASRAALIGSTTAAIAASPFYAKLFGIGSMPGAVAASEAALGCGAPIDVGLVSDAVVALRQCRDYVLAVQVTGFRLLGAATARAAPSSKGLSLNDSSMLLTADGQSTTARSGDHRGVSPVEVATAAAANPPAPASSLLLAMPRFSPMAPAVTPRRSPISPGQSHAAATGAADCDWLLFGPSRDKWLDGAVLQLHLATTLALGGATESTTVPQSAAASGHSTPPSQVDKAAAAILRAVRRTCVVVFNWATDATGDAADVAKLSPAWSQAANASAALVPVTQALISFMTRSVLSCGGGTTLPLQAALASMLTAGFVHDVMFRCLQLALAPIVAAIGAPGKAADGSAIIVPLPPAVKRDKRRGPALTATREEENRFLAAFAAAHDHPPPTVKGSSPAEETLTQAQWSDCAVAAGACILVSVRCEGVLTAEEQGDVSAETITFASVLQKTTAFSDRWNATLNDATFLDALDALTSALIAPSPPQAATLSRQRSGKQGSVRFTGGGGVKSMSMAERKKPAARPRRPSVFTATGAGDDLQAPDALATDNSAGATDAGATDAGDDRLTSTDASSKAAPVHRDKLSEHPRVLRVVVGCRVAQFLRLAQRFATDAVPNVGARTSDHSAAASVALRRGPMGSSAFIEQLEGAAATIQRCLHRQLYRATCWRPLMTRQAATTSPLAAAANLRRSPTVGAVPLPPPTSKRLKWRLVAAPAYHAWLQHRARLTLQHLAMPLFYDVALPFFVFHRRWPLLLKQAVEERELIVRQAIVDAEEPAAFRMVAQDLVRALAQERLAHVQCAAEPFGRRALVADSYEALFTEVGDALLAIHVAAMTEAALKGACDALAREEGRHRFALHHAVVRMLATGGGDGGSGIFHDNTDATGISPFVECLWEGFLADYGRIRRSWTTRFAESHSRHLLAAAECAEGFDLFHRSLAWAEAHDYARDITQPSSALVAVAGVLKEERSKRLQLEDAIFFGPGSDVTPEDGFCCWQDLLVKRVKVEAVLLESGCIAERASLLEDWCVDTWFDTVDGVIAMEERHSRATLHREFARSAAEAVRRTLEASESRHRHVIWRDGTSIAAYLDFAECEETSRRSLGVGADEAWASSKLFLLWEGMARTALEAHIRDLTLPVQYCVCTTHFLPLIVASCEAAARRASLLDVAHHGLWANFVQHHREWKPMEMAALEDVARHATDEAESQSREQIRHTKLEAEFAHARVGLERECVAARTADVECPELAERLLLLVVRGLAMKHAVGHEEERLAVLLVQRCETQIRRGITEAAPRVMQNMYKQLVVDDRRAVMAEEHRAYELIRDEAVLFIDMTLRRQRLEGLERDRRAQLSVLAALDAADSVERLAAAADPRRGGDCPPLPPAALRSRSKHAVHAPGTMLHPNQRAMSHRDEYAAKMRAMRMPVWDTASAEHRHTTLLLSSTTPVVPPQSLPQEVLSMSGVTSAAFSASSPRSPGRRRAMSDAREAPVAPTESPSRRRTALRHHISSLPAAIRAAIATHRLVSPVRRRGEIIRQDPNGIVPADVVDDAFRNCLADVIVAESVARRDAVHQPWWDAWHDLRALSVNRIKQLKGSAALPDAFDAAYVQLPVSVTGPLIAAESRRRTSLCEQWEEVFVLALVSLQEQLVSSRMAESLGPQAVLSPHGGMTRASRLRAVAASEKRHQLEHKADGGPTAKGQPATPPPVLAPLPHGRHRIEAAAAPPRRSQSNLEKPSKPHRLVPL